MTGRYPKPDAERRNRHAPVFGWTILAPRRRGRAPALPERGLGWQPETVAWWRDLWASPQAAMWDPSGRTLWAAARLFDRAAREDTSAAVEAELRQHYDRHGLSPRAMLQLRWRVAVPGDAGGAVTAAPPAAAAEGLSQAQRRRLLRSLNEAS